MKTICFFNLKGGVGKTMTTANVGYLLAAMYGNKVLCIDADAQGNLSQYFGVEPVEGATTVELMQGLVGWDYPDFVTHTSFAGVDIIPSTSDLMDLDVSAIRTGRAKLNAIDTLRQVIIGDNMDDGGYDYMLIDCPPSFSAASSAALAAADEVIIPLRIDAFSTAGMAELTAQIRNMRSINPRIVLRGLLVTQFAPSPEANSALEWLRYQSGLPVFSKPIRNSPRVCGSTFAKQPLEIFSKSCAAAVDYRWLVATIMGDNDYGI